MPPFHGPRNRPHAKKPGAYQLITRTSETTINAGETLSFGQYITGYGEIESAKLQCYFPTEAFEKEASTVTHSLGNRVVNGEPYVYWGSQVDTIQDLFCVSIAEAAAFRDQPGFDRAILSELKIPNAPFEYKLKTKKTIRAGEHHLDFYLVYFNGNEWTINKEKVSFKVNNFFEKYSAGLSIAALIALVVTIAHDGIWPLIESFFKIK